MKVFLDTNMLFSAVHSDGLCRELLFWPTDTADTAEKDENPFDVPPKLIIKYVISDRVIAELTRIFVTKLKYSAVRTAALISNIVTMIPLVPASEVTIPCPDESDGWILADALLAGCEYFVTGDRIVLNLYSVQGMRIISPRELMDFLFTGKAIPKFEAHEDLAEYLSKRLENHAFAV
jgi:predicted nucleic acid-binding protein